MQFAELEDAGAEVDWFVIDDGELGQLDDVVVFVELNVALVVGL